MGVRHDVAPELPERPLQPRGTGATGRARIHPSTGFPTIPQVPARPCRAAQPAVEKRAPAQLHGRRHQHELLSARADPPSLGFLLHPPPVRQPPYLQAGSAGLPRPCSGTGPPGGVVHRGDPEPDRQGIAAHLRPAHLRRRGPVERPMRRHPCDTGIHQLRPRGGSRTLRRGAARGGQAAGDLHLDGQERPDDGPGLRRHPCPPGRATVHGRVVREGDPSWGW